MMETVAAVFMFCWGIVSVVATFAAGVIYAIAVGLFWLTLALFALLAVMALTGNLKGTTEKAAAASAVDQIRAAMRRGEFDADIARILQRNAQRGRVN